MGVCTKERKGVAAEVLMATPCTNSLGGESDDDDDDVGGTSMKAVGGTHGHSLRWTLWLK